jgi:GTP cyclohydrolase II
MHDAERGLFDLQRGRSLLITTEADRAGHHGTLVAAVEGLRGHTVEELKSIGGRGIRLALTRHRARAMGLALDGKAIPISLGLNGASRPDDILRLSTAPRSMDRPSDVRGASEPEVGGLTLTRLSRLIPAVVGVSVSTEGTPELRTALESGAILRVTTNQIDELASDARVKLTHVSEGPVPLEGAEDARFMFFREGNGILEHVAVLIGEQDRWPDPVPVRIHSACLTGDLFGSLRCDCGEQLRGCLDIFSAGGGGVLLYLAQEGRGIGLGNKLRAYALQQDGLDTVDADCTLGFGADERCYDAAVQMLQHLKVQRVQLFTNNPDKVRAVRESGIQVIERQPLYGTLNRHNLRYVRAKVRRAGHWLGDMLSGAVAGE